MPVSFFVDPAIVEALEKSIRSRQLQPGQQLPTQRDLADRLGISVQTVSRAYAEAEPTVQADREAANRFDLYIGALCGLGLASQSDRDCLPDDFKG